MAVGESDPERVVGAFLVERGFGAFTGQRPRLCLRRSMLGVR
jgi:hypothetical protein